MAVLPSLGAINRFPRDSATRWCTIKRWTIRSPRCLGALLGHARGAVVPNGLRAIANWSALSAAQLLDDSWRTGRSTQDIQYLPNDVVMQLSRAYAQHRIADQSDGF
jgi:hypothetical protein